MNIKLFQLQVNGMSEIVYFLLSQVLKYSFISPMDSPHKGPVMQKVFPFHDKIMGQHTHHYHAIPSSK